MRAVLIGFCLLLASCASPRAAEGVPEGKVVVAVTIGDGGVVERTKLVSEEPKGQGFGDAALNAVSRYKFPDSKPGTYQITIKFRPDDGGAPVVAP